MRHLEKDVALQQNVENGMALVRKVKPTGHTYQSYADHLLASAMSSSGNASRVDIVFDVYRDQSIKNAQRGNRENGKLEIKKIIGSQKVKQFTSLLSNGKHKMALIRYLAARWKTAHFLRKPV